MSSHHVSPSKTSRKRKKLSSVWESVKTIKDEGNTYLRCSLPECIWNYEVTSYIMSKKPIPTTIIHRHLRDHQDNFEFESTDDSPSLFDSEEQ